MSGDDAAQQQRHDKVQVDISLFPREQRTEHLTNGVKVLGNTPGLRSISLLPNTVALQDFDDMANGALSSAALVPSTEVTGYVVLCDANLVHSKSMLYRALKSNAGAGVSWFELKNAPPSETEELGALARLSDQLQADSPLHHVEVSHVVSHEHFNTRHYVVARDVYRPVHSEFRAPSSAATTPLDGVRANSLHSLVKSAEYRQTLEHRAAVRMAAAEQFAEQLKLVSAPSQLHFVDSVLTHHARPLNNTTDTAAAAAATSPSTFIVYNESTDPSRAQSGVPVYHGALAGYTLYRGAPRTDGQGNPTRGWSNETRHRRGVNVFPADTGRALVKSARARHVHPGASDEMRAEAERRLAWSGSAYNPPATHAFYAGDAVWANALEEMSEGERSVPEAQSFSARCTHLATFDTQHFSLARQVHVAKKTGEPSVRVSVHSGVPELLARHWPHVVAATADASAPTTLAQAFARESDDHTSVHLSTALLQALHAIVHDTSTAGGAAAAAQP